MANTLVDRIKSIKDSYQLERREKIIKKKLNKKTDLIFWTTLIEKPAH